MQYLLRALFSIPERTRNGDIPSRPKPDNNAHTNAGRHAPTTREAHTQHDKTHPEQQKLAPHNSSDALIGRPLLHVLCVRNAALRAHGEHLDARSHGWPPGGVVVPARADQRLEALEARGKADCRALFGGGEGERHVDPGFTSKGNLARNSTRSGNTGTSELPDSIESPFLPSYSVEALLCFP